jgi:hypothetical protein
VIGAAPKSNYHARVLHGVVREKELRADHTNVSSKRILGESVEPPRCDRFSIVVEKNEHAASGMLYAEVVQSAPVEVAIGMDNASSRETVGQAIEKC